MSKTKQSNFKQIRVPVASLPLVERMQRKIAKETHGMRHISQTEATGTLIALGAQAAGLGEK